MKSHWSVSYAYVHWPESYLDLVTDFCPKTLLVQYSLCCLDLFINWSVCFAFTYGCFFSFRRISSKGIRAPSVNPGLWHNTCIKLAWDIAGTNSPEANHSDITLTTLGNVCHQPNVISCRFSAENCSVKDWPGLRFIPALHWCFSAWSAVQRGLKTQVVPKWGDDGDGRKAGPDPTIPMRFPSCEYRPFL